MELELRGKQAVITGGSVGIGLAVAEALAAEGVDVALVARDGERAAARAAEIVGHFGVKAVGIAADVSKAADCDRALAEVQAAFGGADILINNAGTGSNETVMNAPDEKWQYYWDLHVMAAVRLCRLVIPHMKKRGGGRIVNVTTVGGKAPTARALPTSVTRAAGINLTKSLANEYAPDRILVNTICLGLVKSAQWERRAKGDLEGYYREVAKRVPVGRVGEAEEFADLAAFLCSARAAYITGTAINFDGGMSAAF